MILKHQFYKQFRIYPTISQKREIQRNFGYARYLWNWCVQKFNENSEFNKDKPKEERRKNPSAFDLANSFRIDVKEQDLDWVKERDSRILMSVTDYFFKATRKFFLQKDAGRPKFKRKGEDKASYTTIPASGLRIKNNRIKLPKIGWVKFRCSKNYISDGVYKRATISTDADRFFVSILVEEEKVELEPTGKSVGIDLGIKTTITTSDGEQFNFKLSKHEYRRLKLSDRRFSRTKKGSNRRVKAKLKRKRRYRKLRNRKHDFIQKITTQIVRNYDTISIEDLNVSGMMKNHHLARKIAENNFYEIKQCLSYKCEWYGRQLIVVDRWFPSSQLCSRCRTQVKEMKDLKKRMFICPHCGLELDRDVNAARNLSTAGDAETYARGVSNRRNRVKTVDSKEPKNQIGKKREDNLSSLHTISWVGEAKCVNPKKFCLTQKIKSDKLTP